MNTTGNKKQSVLLLVVALVAGVLLVGGTVYHLTTPQTSSDAVGETGGERKGQQPASENVARTPKTEIHAGYIVSVIGNNIVLDYVEPLNGDEALKAMIQDGYCKQGDTTKDCFHSVPIYDRNVNPQLRTFTLAPNIEIRGRTGEILTKEQLKGYASNTFMNDGKRLGILFNFTITDTGEVTKAEYEFRP